MFKPYNEFQHNDTPSRLAEMMMLGRNLFHLYNGQVLLVTKAEDTINDIFWRYYNNIGAAALLIHLKTRFMLDEYESSFIYSIINNKLNPSVKNQVKVNGFDLDRINNYKVAPALCVISSVFEYKVIKEWHNDLVSDSNISSEKLFDLLLKIDSDL